jgi:hypothetical protein
VKSGGKGLNSARQEHGGVAKLKRLGAAAQGYLSPNVPVPVAPGFAWRPNTNMLTQKKMRLLRQPQ